MAEMSGLKKFFLYAVPVSLLSIAIVVLNPLPSDTPQQFNQFMNVVYMIYFTTALIPVSVVFVHLREEYGIEISVREVSIAFIGYLSGILGVFILPVYGVWKAVRYLK